MTRRRLACLLLGGLAVLASLAPRVRGTSVPARLTDQAFWRLSADASEPGGYFRSQDITNLTSNELWFQHVIPDLVRRVTPRAVYLGVGPEQNFTYMAALRPPMAIIFDIRRGNLDMQLMYKAIFELSKDRADFVSMLFSAPRLEAVGPDSTATDVFRALSRARPSDTIFARNLAAIEHQLLKVHALPLSAGDLAGVRTIYRLFYDNGIALRASPTYADLMTATDAQGISRSYLATEEGFAWLKDLETRNLVVPVVGDFGGPKAIRAIGTYLKTQHATVGAFYLSNVEQYLYQDRKWAAFCRNVVTLPLDTGSTFIRTVSGGGFGRGGGFLSSLGSMPDDTKGCRAAAHGR